MSKKQLYLHIGMGKTGTTALQEFLWTNKKLLASNGICYPSIGVKSGAHHLLSPHVPAFLKDVWEFISVDTWAPKLTKVPHDKILLSSELMAWADEDIAVRFCESVREWFEPRIVIYLRRQDHLIMAGYNQQIKAGTQKRDIHAVLKHQFVRFDYERKLAPWLAALGENNIIVRPYERQQLYADDIRKDFLHHVFGIEVSNKFKIDTNNSNPRLSLSAMEYKRLLNNLIADTAKSSLFNEALLQYSTSVDKASSDLFSTQSLLSPAVRREILRKSKPVNSMIARKYLGRGDGRLFYDPIPEDLESWEARELSEEDMMDISQFICKKSPRLMKLIKESIRNASLSDDLHTVKVAKLLSTYV